MENDGRIITNDLYLAAYLVCEGCSLAHLEHNRRRRISFVVTGDNVHTLRESYRSGSVELHLPLFKESLLTVRRMMDVKQRSSVCPSSQKILSKA